MMSGLNKEFYMIILSSKLLRAMWYGTLVAKKILRLQKIEARVIMDADARMLLALLFNKLRCIPFYKEAKIAKGQTGKKNILPGSTTWRQKFPSDQQSIFVLNQRVHKHIMF